MTAPPDPEELEATGAPAAAEIDPATTVGPVYLTVADLDRSIGFYERAIGLLALERDGARAALGVGTRMLLELEELPGARPADGYTGLYHYALLVPRRVDLARWLAHAAREHVPLTGASDHFVSEAIYLNDPDRHGIEIYCDRPRELWQGQVGRMGTWPLDVDDLSRELDDPATAPFDGQPGGTVMGHVHLRVAELGGIVSFYRDVVGFGLMAQLGAQAAFLSAGGYHHHLGANIWESAGAPPAPPGTAALRRWTIVLASDEERTRLLNRVADAGHEVGPDGTLRDPSGNAVALEVTSG